MFLKQNYLCKLVKLATGKKCAVKKATIPTVKATESAELKFEDIFCNKCKIDNEPNTIECVNFQMFGFNPSMKELIEGLVYSPSGRYAVNFQKSLGKVRGIFILDSHSMKFYMYEPSNPDNDLFLKMDICYWYGEDCLIFLHGNCRAKKFLQTPIVMNHIKKTFQLKETRSYNFSRFGSVKRKFPRLPIEAKTLLLSGDKYVIWISYPDPRRLLTSVYLIPYEPNSALKCKQFLLAIKAVTITFEMSRIIELLEIGYTISFHDLQFITIDNIAYFPCHLENDEKQILGLYMAINFEKMVDVYDSLIDEYNWAEMLRFWYTERDARNIVEVVPQDTTLISRERYLKNPGIHRKLGNIFVSLIKEKTSDGKNVTTLFYFDCQSQTMEKVYEKVELHHGEAAICLTPFNILYGTEISATKIRCTTVPFPNGNQLLSLKETTMRRTYLTQKW